MGMHRYNDKIEHKPKIRVKAFKEGWSFSYKGEHVGAIWYNGELGGICKQTLAYNPQLK